jgi:hypothetical protein
VCTSSQLYGRKATSIDPQGKSHISDNSICINVSDIKKGDKLLMEASYDSAKHAYDLSMTNNGFDTIMAINNVRIIPVELKNNADLDRCILESCHKRHLVMYFNLSCKYVYYGTIL